MRRNRRSFVVYCTLVTFFLFTGCASVLNPYDSEFKCKETHKGKCVGVHDAYEESLTGLDEYEEACSDDDCKDKKTRKDLLIEKKNHAYVSKPERIYYDSVYREMAGLIQDPSTPVALPPKIIRALIFPYSDTGKSNVLYMPRYLYFFVEERPKWIVGDYIIESEGE